MRVLVVSEGTHEQSGALENLLKKLGGDQADFESEGVSNVRSFHGKGPGYFKKAIACLQLAVNRGFDALIFLIDEDGQKERIQQIRQAQGYLEISLERAMGVAIRMFDAWMLADEKALSKVLGYTVQKQPGPEAENNPKQRCKELLDKGNKSMAQRKMYAEIAYNIDINTLSRRCKIGFKPFAENVRKIFQ